MADIKSTIDYCMLHENDLKQAIYWKKHDRDTKGGGHSTGISKPTEAEALWNLAKVGTVLVNNLVVVYNPENMLEAIRYTKAHFNADDKYGRIYCARYILHEDYLDTIDRMRISRATYYNHKNIILEYAEKRLEKMQC